MKQSKNRDQWYLDMKAHIGADAEQGLVHKVRGSAGNINDVTEANALLHGEETEAFGEAGNQGASKRPDATPRVNWNIAMGSAKRLALGKSREVNLLIGNLEKLMASIRAKEEHPFRVIQHQFVHVKLCYLELETNTVQIHTPFAISNLWMVHRQLGRVQT